jgi:hypothetical protein
VDVLRAGDGHADVEELPHPGLAGQEAHRPADERPQGPHCGLCRLDAAGQGLTHAVGDVAVGGEVVVAAGEVVLDPCGVGHVAIDRERVTIVVARARRISQLTPFGHVKVCPL